MIVMKTKNIFVDDKNKKEATVRITVPLVMALPFVNFKTKPSDLNRITITLYCLE